MKKRIFELEKYYSGVPEWYWIYGLHDAEILSFSEMQLPPDWKSKTPRYNCLEIQLNSVGAMTKIKKIVFYNYSLKSDFEIKISKIGVQNQKTTRFFLGTNVSFEQDSKVHFTAV